jgi:hypothetical protein
MLRRVGLARAGGFLCCHPGGVGETPGRVPDAQPAIAEPACPPDRHVGAAVDDDGNGRGMCGGDERLIKVEELAMEGDRCARQELANDGEAFLHPQPSGGRVHPADRGFVAVLTTHPDTEDEAPRSDPVDICELPGHQDGMTQRQQVHAAEDGQCGMEHGQRGGLHEPVEPCAGEAHVVSAADMVDARLPGPRQQCPSSLPAPFQQVEGRKHADPS